MSPPDSKLVTVVVPARNEAGRIGPLVRAVLAQGEHSLENVLKETLRRMGR